MSAAFRSLSILALSLSLLAFASIGFSSEARMGTLQYSPGVNDDTDIFTYPATVNRYSLAIIELGTGTGAANTNAHGGVIYSSSESGPRIGVVVSRDQSLVTGDWLKGSTSNFSLVSDWYDKTTSNGQNGAFAAPEKPLDIFYGQKLGGGASWGLRLTYATYKNNQETTTGGQTSKSTSKADQLDLHGGYSKGSMDFGLMLGLIGDHESKTENAGAPVTSAKIKRGTSFRLSFRHRLGSKGLFYELGLAMRSPKITVDNGATNGSKKFKEQGVHAEVGKRIKAGTGTLVVASGQLLNVESEGPVVTTGSAGTATAPAMSVPGDEDSVKAETLALFANLGVESKVWSSVGILGDLRYALWGATEVTDKVNFESSESETSIATTTDANLWSLGAFYTEGPLRVDATVARAIFHNGPFFVSGTATAGLLGRISVSYSL